MSTIEPGEVIDALWRDSIIESLAEYIRIPCKSAAFDPDWAAHGTLQDAARLLKDWALDLGVHGLVLDVIEHEGRPPVLFGEVPARGAAAGPTVLMYGHYDKQPEFDGWRSGLDPWTPVLEDGRLYGRGGADDGYALYASLAAILALQQSDRAHPRCVLLIEGSEESGSPDLPAYLDLLRDRMGTPELVVCLDAECGNWDTMWMTTSLRGLVRGVLDVRILTEGVHSGAASGIVPSSMRIVRQLLDRIENAVTGEVFDALQVPIPQAAARQAEAVADELGALIVDRYPWVPGAGAEPRPLAQMLLDTTWRATLSVTGADGLPATALAGNTLRPFTRLMLSLRLPPTLSAETASRAVQVELERNPPSNARVRFEISSAETGWAAPPIADWLDRAVNAASLAAFGRSALSMGTGGTIPFMKMLGDTWPDVQFLITGVLGPHSNAHGPNEFLHIDTARRLTRMVADVLEVCARRAGN